uniref:Uncharacterized protein LOC114338272 n=1 Tax=Diabrotica virgifera virgifera TaxID=50390 RepID=A0A6P7GE74_DIAVI
MTDVTFPVVVRTLDRYGVSDRARVAIISAAFHDIGLITENDSSRVITEIEFDELVLKLGLLCNSILTFLSSNSIDVNQIMAVGCDGTVVNQGNKGGVIRLLEIKFPPPLQ